MFKGSTISLDFSCIFQIKLKQTNGGLLYDYVNNIY